MGATLKDILQDTNHGCPIEMIDVESHSEISLDRTRELFKPSTYQAAYDCITNPNLQDVFFMGPADY